MSTHSACHLLVQRCAEVGLACWWVDETGAVQPGHGCEQILARAGIDGDSSAILRTVRDLGLAVETGQFRVTRTGSARFAAMSDSKWTAGRGSCVAMLPDVRSPFGDGGDGPVVVPDIASVLGLMHADLLKMEASEGAIEGFTQQLTQTFEEQEFIYRMMRKRSKISLPESVVQWLCSEIRQAGCFEWAAASFLSSELVPSSLHDWFFLDGDAPCSESEMLDGLRRMQTRVGASAEIVTPCGDPAVFCNTSGLETVLRSIVSDGRTIGVLQAGFRSDGTRFLVSNALKVVSAAAEFLGVFIHNATLYASQKSMFLGTVRGLTSAIDAKDPYTCGHSERVAHLGARLADAVGMDENAVERLRITGLLHDVGKIGVPEAVLTKPGRLTKEEFDEIKKHPDIGCRILQGIAPLEYALPGVRHHHERWDGRGYPCGLAGENIPLDGRLLALADTFDAMSSNRSYRSALSREKVIAEIHQCTASQFDPALAPAFLELSFAEYDAMLEEHKHSAEDDLPAAA